jgi:serine/threonine-protein kinase
MAQDVGPEGVGPQTADTSGGRRSIGALPWIALALLVIVVIMLLWWYWRTPAGGNVTVTKTTVTEIPLTTPEPRPEPVIPTAVAESAEASASGVGVPDVVGDPKASAVRTLEAAGYIVSTDLVYTTSKASGLVIGQNPSGGATLDPGSPVSITVSQAAKDVGNVTMPNVIGLTKSAAESKVKSAGLTPYITYGQAVSGYPNGHVMSQYPEAGDSVPRGSQGLIQVVLVP